MTDQSLLQQLFAMPGTKVYAILDGASIPQLPEILARLEVEAECLYRGELAPDLAEAAPYLARVLFDHPFTDWLLPKAVCHKTSCLFLRILQMVLRRQRLPACAV